MIGRTALLAGMQAVIAIWGNDLARRPRCQGLNIRRPAGVQGALVDKACTMGSA